MGRSMRARMGLGFLLVLGITVAHAAAAAQLRPGALQGRPLVLPVILSSIVIPGDRPSGRWP